MKCEQREAFVDGKPRRLFFMDGLIAGGQPTAASAQAFADGLKAMQGACVSGVCALRHCVRRALTRALSGARAAEHGVSMQFEEEV